MTGVSISVSARVSRASPQFFPYWRAGCFACVARRWRAGSGRHAGRPADAQRGKYPAPYCARCRPAGRTAWPRRRAGRILHARNGKIPGRERGRSVAWHSRTRLRIARWGVQGGDGGCAHVGWRLESDDHGSVATGTGRSVRSFGIGVSILPCGDGRNAAHFRWPRTG